MRTFIRKIGVDFTKKSMNITNIGGVMNNNILTKIVIFVEILINLDMGVQSCFCHNFVTK